MVFAPFLSHLAHSAILMLAVCAASCGVSAVEPGVAASAPQNSTTANDLRLYVESGIHHSARAVAFSADAKFLATGSLDRTIKVWEVRSSRELSTLPNSLMSETLIFLPSHPVVLSANEDGTITAWDIEAQSLLATLTCSRTGRIAIGLADEGQTIACGDEGDRLIRRWRSDTFEPGPSVAVPSEVALSKWRLSGDATLLAGNDSEGRLTVVDVGTWRKLEDFPTSRQYAIEAMAFGPSRGIVVGVDGDRLIVWRWSAKDGRVPIEERSIPASIAHSVAFSADERQLAFASESGDVVVLDTATWKETSRLRSRANRIEKAGGIEGSPLLFVKVWYEKVFAFNLNKGVLEEEVTSKTAPDDSEWSDTITFEGAPFAVEYNNVDVAGHTADFVRIRSLLQGGEVFRLVMLDKRESWVAIAPDGRFDTNLDLATSKGVHWIEGSRVYEPLPLETFMRDYYEPRLVPRSLSCAARRARDPRACESQFKPIRPLGTLNRVRPSVRIVSVGRGTAADEAIVEVEALPGEDRSQRNGKTRTEAYDVRLFRDGQLVGEWPTPPASTDDSLASWQAHARVPAQRHRFTVRLASSNSERPVSFTAYAFNDDRVKSDTAEASLPVSVGDASRPRRAYVLTVGINGYQDGKRDLAFAVNDAKAIADVLKRFRGYETTTVSLISVAPFKPGDAGQATKAAIHRAFVALAGKARPDDLVVVSFSSHGYTTRDGQFYIVPADARVSEIGTPESMRKLISATELSEWLREVDAGTLVMVIDTCHAAQSVDAAGFKPGPMGDRGFGQLAYDKRMQILAATQGDDVASEFPALRHGVLTYTLVDEALQAIGSRRAADLNGDGNLAIGEWLRFAEKLTPQVYDDAIDGKIRNVAPVGPAVGSTLRRRAQTPALFDFQKRSDEIFIDP